MGASMQHQSLKVQRGAVISTHAEGSILLWHHVFDGAGHCCAGRGAGLLVRPNAAPAALVRLSPDHGWRSGCTRFDARFHSYTKKFCRRHGQRALPQI